MTILEELRARAVSWVRTATLDQLGNLPSEVLHTEVTEAKTAVARRRLPRIPKRANGKMTREQADAIRLAMKGLKSDSPSYSKKMEELCREMHFTRRQVSAAITGLARVAVRKKRKLRNAKITKA